MLARSLALSALLSAFVAGAMSCASTSSSPTSTLPSSSADSGDASTSADGEKDASASGDTIAAADYCESIAGFFCDFYLRCDRMVAADTKECQKVFLETCNARYEPRYVDLERAKLLTLSRAGVDACAAHLAKVACSEQVSDLDGPCGAMWIGSAPAGAPCAIDVESFVCAPGTTCIVGLDFCGTCDATVARGSACEPGAVRCAANDACVDGTCVARPLPGQPCTDSLPCTVGATCTNGTCVAPTVVGEGEACDAKHRCAYRSYCDASKCVRASLLGEPCTSDRVCASGRCDTGKCVPLEDDGTSCTAPSQCSSAQCVDGKCAPLPSACLTR